MPSPCLRSLTKETLSLVKHQNGVLVLSLLKDGVYVLGALSHPLAEEFPAIHHLQWLPHFIANGLGHQGFASARIAMKEDCQAFVVPLGKAPLPKEYGSACMYE